MHMADALVSPAVAGTLYAVSSVATVYSIKKIKTDYTPEKIPVMGVMGAVVFAAQMINFSIPGTGSSGHICGGILLAALLGPYAGFLSMVVILAIQCLLFADGGLMALGCNIWNMAFYACFVGYFLIYRPIMKKGFSRVKIIIASIVGNIISLQLGAFSVVLETSLSNVSELSFVSFLSMMQPIHLVIGFIEGLITAAVLLFVYQARPELLDKSAVSGKMAWKKFIAVLAIIAVLLGGGVSLLASSNPDGLEWSVQKVADSDVIEGSEAVYDMALLPDYSFKDGGILGTSVSGVVGAVVVAGVCIGGCLAYRKFRKKKKDVEAL